MWEFPTWSGGWGTERLNNLSQVTQQNLNLCRSVAQKPWSTQPHTSKSFWHKPQDISGLRLSWSNKGNIICGKSVWRDISSDSFAILFSLDNWMLSVYSLEVLPVEDEMRHLLKNSLKVCEWTSEAAWPARFQRPGAGSEVYTGKWELGAPLWELAGWREDTALASEGPRMNQLAHQLISPAAHEPGLTRASGSFLVSFSFLHLHFYYGKCKHTEKLKKKYYNEHPYAHLLSTTIANTVAYLLHL